MDRAVSLGVFDFLAEMMAFRPAERWQRKKHYIEGASQMRDMR
jgi:hypothetical protein